MRNYSSVDYYYNDHVNMQFKKNYTSVIDCGNDGCAIDMIIINNAVWMRCSFDENYNYLRGITNKVSSIEYFYANQIGETKREVIEFYYLGCF